MLRVFVFQVESVDSRYGCEALRSSRNCGSRRSRWRRLRDMYFLSGRTDRSRKPDLMVLLKTVRSRITPAAVDRGFLRACISGCCAAGHSSGRRHTGRSDTRIAGRTSWAK